MTLRYLIAAFLLLTSILTPPAEGATLHAVMVYDTLSTDIGCTVKVDQKKMDAFIDFVQSTTQMDVNKLSFSGYSYSSNLVMDNLKKLDVRPDDVVIFYYSGHGYRTTHQESPWPALSVPTSFKPILMDQVIHTINAKSPRFTLVLTDCCNNILPDFGGMLCTPQQVGVNKKSVINKNMRRLFLEQRGTIIATGSEPGFPSKCNESLGGFFTYAFFYSFSHCIRNYSEVDWKSIFQMTENILVKQQTPVYMLTER